MARGDSVAVTPPPDAGGTPVPFSATTCAPSASWMVIWPRSAPTALGEYTTASAQALCPGSAMPHRFVTAKSPVTCTLMLVSALSPPLLTVTCCAALVVPIGCAVCVPASSVAPRLPDAAPDDAGEKTTPTVQLVFTGSEEPQVFAVMVNGPLMFSGFSPATFAPVLATVMYCTGLVCPIRSDPKSIRSGVSTIVPGCVPVPCTLAVKIPPCTLAAIVTVPLRCPVAVGANTIAIAHDAPGASVAGHWLPLKTKSLLLSVGAPSVSTIAPVFSIVRLSAPLVVATACAAKLSVAGEMVAAAVAVFNAVLASSACHTPRPFVPARSHFCPLVSTALSVVTRTAGSPAPYALQQLCFTSAHCVTDVVT